MRLLYIILRSALRTQLSGRRIWLLLLPPLIALGAVRLLPPEEVSAPVQVGVVLPEAGGEDFWRRLEERSGLAVTFHAAPQSRAVQRVAAGQWDCALVLPKDFANRLRRLDTEGLFTLLTAPGSAAYPMVRETVTACLAECISPAMAEKYLLDSGISEEAELPSVRPRLQEVLEAQERVLVTMETLDGRPLEPLTLAGRGVSGLLAGLTAVLLLIWTLLTAMDLGRWLDSPFARRLVPLRGRLSLLLPRLAAALAPALGSGALALLAVERPLACMLSLLPYLLFWGAAALVLAWRRPLWGALPVLMPFVPVLCLLLSPVLLDLSLLFPALGPVIRWMPVTLYLRACGGAWTDGLLLAAAGAAILAAMWVLDREKA